MTKQYKTALVQPTLVTSLASKSVWMSRFPKKLTGDTPTVTVTDTIVHDRYNAALVSRCNVTTDLCESVYIYICLLYYIIGILYCITCLFISGFITFHSPFQFIGSVQLFLIFLLRKSNGEKGCTVCGVISHIVHLTLTFTGKRGLTILPLKVPSYVGTMHVRRCRCQGEIRPPCHDHHRCYWDSKHPTDQCHTNCSMPYSQLQCGRIPAKGLAESSDNIEQCIWRDVVLCPSRWIFGPFWTKKYLYGALRIRHKRLHVQPICLVTCCGRGSYCGAE